MARKVKIPNEQLKRYARQEQKRKLNVRAKRMYYLIVCEGEATEPNYFEGLKQDLPKGVLTACQIDIEGTGRNTQSLVDETLRLKEEYEKDRTQPVDKLWVVFDRDSFAANEFNNAINRCTQNLPTIGCAWSNEAFELWYLLHFHFYQNAMNRQQYQGLIENNLRPVIGEAYSYEKNSQQMYALLKEHGSIDNAIRNAQRLAESYGERQDYANHNPCTMVFKLIIELRQLNENG
ncbi:MAG: hypothetical protein BGO69_14600 [Bacteroidetes bacterium 46-16]|nr:MAG: hypothetical protein BGO69_14600 [Bacteroidetes bacterium 46-16]